MPGSALSLSTSPRTLTLHGLRLTSLVTVFFYSLHSFLYNMSPILALNFSVYFLRFPPAVEDEELSLLQLGT